MTRSDHKFAALLLLVGIVLVAGALFLASRGAP